MGEPLIGYVSDEQYVALAEVAFELEGPAGVVSGRTTASGALRADVPPGDYRLTLARPGFTGKRVELSLPLAHPACFRLMSDRLSGFMNPPWSRAGEVAEYCIHSREQFELELWRYGWDKQRVARLGWCDEHAPFAMAQVLPDGDFTQTGVAWNRAGYTLRYQQHQLTAPEESGLYYLHATTRSGKFLGFPWIVSPRSPQARIAVLASTLTWNAYNSFGGRSNYFNQDGLPPQPIVNSRQEVGRYTHPDTWPFDQCGAPLSLLRPNPSSEVPLSDGITDPIAGRTESCFAPGEWRLLGWLEREHFSFDLYSETELHFGRVPLDAYDVLILNTHPEYWSAEMYAQVKRWVYAGGGKLAYLGGCGLYAEVEFDDEFTIRCRREGEWTLRGESAARLLGVEYTHDGFQSGAPYEVLDGAHWVFENTGLRTGERFGFASLHERCPGGASAHELDKRAPESPAAVQCLARGTNGEGQGAEMTFYETPGGGAVFAAGSLCWTLALPIDAGVSQITRNVLTRLLAPNP